MVPLNHLQQLGSRSAVMAKNKTPDGVPSGDGPAIPAAPEGTKPPPFGTAVTADATGTLPRVVKELERATRDTLRFKIRASNYAPRNKVRYILAGRGDGAEAQARACYLKAEGLDKELERLRKVAGSKSSEVEEPDLVVTTLDD